MSRDDFSDVDIESYGYGSLAGEGATQHDTVKSSIAEDGSGFSNEIRCEKCGKTLLLTVPWPELIIMAAGVLPPNNSWLYNQQRGCFMPANQCSCGAYVRLGVTPDECSRQVKAGLAARKLTPQQIQQVQQAYLGGQR